MQKRMEYLAARITPGSRVGWIGGEFIADRVDLHWERGRLIGGEIIDSEFRIHTLIALASYAVDTESLPPPPPDGEQE